MAPTATMEYEARIQFAVAAMSARKAMGNAAQKF
jgi:hypothetical protein